MNLDRFPGDFLYLDESGDPGVSAESSRVLVIGVAHLGSEFALSRVMKRVRKKALKTKSINEMKFSGSSDEVRWAGIHQIIREGAGLIGVSGAVMRKDWIDPHFAGRTPDERYNYAVRFALEKGMLFEPKRARALRLTIDARNRFATRRLKDYLGKLRADGALCCEVDFRAEDSQRLPQLQIADFLTGAIFQAYARGAWGYLNALRDGGVAINLRVLQPKKKPAP